MISALVYGFVTGIIGGEVFAGFIGTIITYYFMKDKIDKPEETEEIITEEQVKNSIL